MGKPGQRKEVCFGLCGFGSTKKHAVSRDVIPCEIKNTPQGNCFFRAG